MATVTKKMTKDEIQSLKKRMAPYIKSESQPQYTYYQIKCSECSITAYTSGKVVFQGKDLSWLEEDKEESNEVFPQAGSDEVGTGDYFGPIVVAACIIEDQSDYLRSLGIQDSKQVQDDKIRKLAPIIKENTKYSILIVPNKKYNEIYPDYNMVGMKCQLHNQAYVNLIHKGYTLPKQIVIDQFVQESSYYRYLQNNKEVVKGIIFETKAENKYLAVACASILARNAFLEYFDQLEEKYHFKFQKGAGSPADECAKQFVKLFGKDELINVAKLHFKNTKKL